MFCWIFSFLGVIVGRILFVFGGGLGLIWVNGWCRISNEKINAQTPIKVFRQNSWLIKRQEPHNTTQKEPQDPLPSFQRTDLLLQLHMWDSDVVCIILRAGTLEHCKNP